MWVTVTNGGVLSWRQQSPNRAACAGAAEDTSAALDFLGGAWCVLVER